ncbi:MAG TPA: FG-GAP and VCBS repeat-containing protein, partial [Luteolibacter sp.]|nr:FG-GAP and VCBS repeat-containing protein [Luteolibacter sp.]
MKPAFLLLALAAPASAGFRPQTIDDKISIGYGLAVADVDGDGKQDILLVDTAETVWYQNPTWEKRKLTGKLTPKDHVCVCAKDLDGDKKAEIAVGAEWAPNDTKDSGAVFALFPSGDRNQPWTHKALHREPTTHRMHWVL